MSEEINTNFPPIAPARQATLQSYLENGFLNIIRSSRRLLVLVFMLVIFAAAARPIKDPDFYWHLKTGQYLLETRSIPKVDMFSSVKFGSEWVTHEWMSELFMYSIFRVFGYLGLIVVFSGIITATFSIAYRRCREVAPHPYIAGFALIVGAAATIPTWGVRPQMLSMLFASIFVLVLGDYCRNVRTDAIWLLVPLTVLWVNMHAGFAMGLALIVLTILSLLTDGLLLPDASIKKTWPHVRTLCLLLAGCIGAVCLNPSGARMYSYPFETLTSHAMMQYIQEWKSPNFHEPMFQALALLFLATFSALALSGRRPRPGELLVLVVTALATLRSSRNVPFFALVAIPLLAEHSWQWVINQRWGQWFTRPETRETGYASTLKIVLNILLLLITPLTVIAIRVGNSVANQPATEAGFYPAAAVNFIAKEKPPQPIFNEYVWGGYLIWRLYPEYRVNMDGRADVYGDELVEEFLAVHDGEPKWREALVRQGIRTVLVKPDVPLASLLREDKAWQKVFEDNASIIFVRK
jgi:hypothetical protein